MNFFDLHEFGKMSRRRKFEGGTSSGGGKCPAYIVKMTAVNDAGEMLCVANAQSPRHDIVKQFIHDACVSDLPGDACSRDISW